MAKGLTDKQKIFVNEYLIDLNATRAYKVAYPNCKTENAASAAASKMLRNVKVQEQISEKMKEREVRTNISQDRVLKELAAIAFSNGTEFAKIIEKQAVVTSPNGHRIPIEDEDGNPVMIRVVQMELTDNLTKEQKKAISGIKEGKYGMEVSSYDKVRALELLGRHFGMFKDKVEVSGLDKEKNKLDDILKQMRGDA